MKYLILYDLVDKFNVLVLKELDDEFYINSDGESTVKMMYNLNLKMVGIMLKRYLKVTSIEKLKE